MNPIVSIVAFFIRGAPWALAGAVGAVVGSVAVRGARAAGTARTGTSPGTAGGPGTSADEAVTGAAPRLPIEVQPAEMIAGAVAGKFLAVLVRPRLIGAFVAGLAAGSLVAATATAGEPFPVPADDES